MRTIYSQVTYSMRGADLLIVIVLLTGTITQIRAGSDECKVRSFGQSSVVCECNATYCDSVGHVSLPPVGHFLSFLSSKAGQRLQREQGQVQKNSTGAALRITLVPTEKYQHVKGFGGAMTDAAAMNILFLSTGAQNQLLRQYFSPEGIEYNVVRVPMASCDFSTRLYTYADSPDDYSLLNFSLAEEDTRMKIPLLQRAQALSARPLSLFAAAWSSPAWLKTSGALIGKGSLKGKPGGKEYKTWAQYYIRFLEEYEKHNLSFWGLTTGNEPTAGELTNYSFQALGFTPELQRDWIAMDLGPALHSSPYAKTRLMILDDNRLLLPHWAKVVLSDIHASRYVHGIGVHWYWDHLVPAKISLTATHELYPEYFILGTEACPGWSSLDHGVRLGSWERAEDYAHDIIEDLNNYVTGWTDWNLALDMSGGPNWVKNFVDSPIIVDRTKDVFYKQPTFYSMAHFSKFLWEGSQRIGVSVSEHTSLESCAFIRPDGSVVLIVLNRSDAEVGFEVWDQTLGFLPASVPPHSILTLLWATS
ncbi:lysosomal acid glucosylceramidase isoform X1 [Ictalurus furcatus]|uniref:lysosomal acid glucosylceramidase isoform X1 n=1 Tax=Ictalurus furcatus TaxID=66913 RepID=UPI00234FC0F6|nr:lysosomal acid glucosylceramidase isoform X1 [Ictalurus furcatus]